VGKSEPWLAPAMRRPRLAPQRSDQKLPSRFHCSLENGAEGQSPKDPTAAKAGGSPPST